MFTILTTLDDAPSRKRYKILVTSSADLSPPQKFTTARVPKFVPFEFRRASRRAIGRTLTYRYAIVRILMVRYNSVWRPMNPIFTTTIWQ
jgi:hypothetical protein